MIKMDKELINFLKNKKVFLMDFDGTIADTEPLNYETIRRMLATENIEFTPEHFKAVLGKPATEYADYINKTFNTNYELTDTVAQYVDTYKVVEKEVEIETLEYINKLLATFDDKRYVILSNMFSDVIQNMLNRWGISDKFEEIFSCSNMKIKKKEFYTDVQTYLGVSAQDCVVFEDSQKYINEAHELGFATVGIEHQYNKGKIEADYVIREQ
ncbi:MAG: HAD family phosphatase [Clostridia bacterium]|nr:HAD family phosphatase [Clostridia bacterium]